jgi:hypothetical protein
LKIEREELENHGSSRFYDVTAWNLPMSFGLQSYWVDSIADVNADIQPPASVERPADWNSKPKYGYIIDFSSAAVYDVMTRLFEQGCHLRVARKPFDVHGHHYHPGAILLRGHENPDNLREILKKLTAEFDVIIRPAQTASVGKRGPDLGGPKFVLLHPPRVALFADGMPNSAGAVWHLLDHRLKMRISPIEQMRDLRKYSVLILPGIGSISEEVKSWVSDGGTLIAFGSAANRIANEKSGLSSVRLRRDVLDQLAVYREDLDREQRADVVEIDFDDLWSNRIVDSDRNQVTESTAAKPAKKNTPSNDLKKLKRIDSWQRIFSPTGVFLKARVDGRHWLGFGLGDFLPVAVGSENVFMSMYPTETPVRLVDEDELRLSGLLWPEARQRLANSSFATVDQHGRGQVILFASDPTFRGWYPGMERLFLNAILLGPGMGTDQRMPW